MAPDVVVGVCNEFKSSPAQQQTYDIYSDENCGANEASHPIEVFLTSGAVETCLMTPDEETTKYNPFTVIQSGVEISQLGNVITDHM